MSSDWLAADPPTWEWPAVPSMLEHAATLFATAAAVSLMGRSLAETIRGAAGTFSSAIEAARE